MLFFICLYPGCFEQFLSFTIQVFCWYIFFLKARHVLFMKAGARHRGCEGRQTRLEISGSHLQARTNKFYIKCVLLSGLSDNVGDEAPRSFPTLTLRYTCTPHPSTTSVSILQPFHSCLAAKRKPMPPMAPQSALKLPDSS